VTIGKKTSQQDIAIYIRSNRINYSIVSIAILYSSFYGIKIVAIQDS